MDIVVKIIMLLAFFSFLLRMTLSDRIAAVAWCAAAALFAGLTRDTVTAQSKITIAEWLSSPDLMLDAAVWITADVAFQIGYCLLAAKAEGGTRGKRERRLFRVCRLLPGVLIFPVLFALHTELVFALPGVDFALVAWSMAGGVMLLFPLLAAGLKWLVPETEIRLELLFMVNLLVAALGIVATVNGRTAAVGTNKIEWTALAGVTVIAEAGFAAGALCNKYLTNKKRTKTK